MAQRFQRSPSFHAGRRAALPGHAHPLAAALARAFSRPTLGATLLAALGAASMPGHAGPQGGTVVTGQASVQQRGALMTITQGSQRAIIDWRSFNVGAQETVRFQQPNSQAATLNRVLGSDPSAIFGRVEANGQLFLVNPNGIIFGRTAKVDVGSLVASTANISNADFMAGRLAFTQPGKAGASVVNEGSITVAQGGLAALVGPSVANSGVIHARLGTVALAAGSAFTLDLTGDKLINLVLSRDVLERVQDVNGQPLAVRLDHSGQIVADGGVVQLSAATVSRLVDSIINVSGDIRATSFDATSGKISLRGDTGTKLNLAGALDTSGTYGGRIEVTAGDVSLGGTARLDASGTYGGGSVSVGGDWQGKGDLPNALRVSVAAGARIDASATRSGDGGTVAVWSDDTTRFEGFIGTRGGAESGNGGNVEVSGKQRLAFDGDADASAFQGRAGMLLLDPTNLIVDGITGANSLPGAGGGEFTVRASAISRQLQRGTSVTLQASNDITVNGNAQIDGRAAKPVPGGGLKLEAGRNVNLNGSVILDNGSFEVIAGGSFTQTAGMSTTGTERIDLVATGSGSINVAAAGRVRATNLLTTGSVNLESSGGFVQVTEALGATASDGRVVSRVASLTLRGTSVTLDKDAFVAGTTTLISTGGAVDTSAATLDTTGAVSIQASSGVNSGAVRSTGAVTMSSTGASGDVALSAVIKGSRIELNSGRDVLVNADVDLRTANGNFNAMTPTGRFVQAADAEIASGSGDITVEAAAGVAATSLVGVGAVSLHASAGSVSVANALGANANSRVGSLLVSGRDGVTLARDALVAGTTTLTSTGGAVNTSAATLDTTGAVSVQAASGISSGAVRSTGAVTMVSTGAAGDVSLNGAVLGRGLELSSGRDVLVNADVDLRTANGNFTAITTAGRFVQAADAEIGTGSGSVDVQAAAGIAATSLLSTGSVSLLATGGSVTVDKALGVDTGSRLGSLQASGRDGVTLSAGALVTGSAVVASTAGGVNTSGGTLDVRGDLSMAAFTQVSSAAIASAGNVSIRGTGNATPIVLTGAVAGEVIAAGGSLIGATTAPAAGLSVSTAGNVQLAGAAVGSGGFTVAGLASGDRAGTITLSKGVYSQGSARVETTGALTIGPDAGIFVGTAADLQITAHANLDVQGPLKTAGGTLSLRSDEGSVTIRQVATSAPGAPSGTLRINAAQDVVLTEGLGGASTGYALFDDKYQSALKPVVGQVLIVAGRDVELNGLNLDGRNDPTPNPFATSWPWSNENLRVSPSYTTEYAGLAVQAGRRIVSNSLVAVNKGEILMWNTTRSAGSGIYLGNSVYSRGFDTATGKTAYALRIEPAQDGGSSIASDMLYLFDNTDEKADFTRTASDGSTSTSSVAKIIVSNNVPNYTLAGGAADPRLVRANNLTMESELSNSFVAASYPVLSVRWDRSPVDSLPGSYPVTANPTPLGLPHAGPLRLDAMPSTFVALDMAPNSNSGMAGTGVALKLQTYVQPRFTLPESPTVLSTQAVAVRYSDSRTGGCSPGPSCSFDDLLFDSFGRGGIAVDGLRADGVTRFDERTNATVSNPFPINVGLLGESFATDVLGYRNVSLDGFNVFGRGALIHGGEGTRYSDTVTTVIREGANQSGTVGYEIRNRLTEVANDANGSLVRMLFYPVTKSSSMQAVFNNVGGLNGGTGLGNTSSGGAFDSTNNSSSGVSGFSAVGTFGNGVVSPVVGNSNVPSSPAAGSGNPAVPDAPVAGTGNGLNPPGRVDAGAGDVTPVRLFEDFVVVDQGSPLLAAVLLGRRPAADADLGRSGAAGGATSSVFQRRYRLAISVDSTVCAPNDVESQGVGTDVRQCKPAK